MTEMGMAAIVERLKLAAADGIAVALNGPAKASADIVPVDTEDLLKSQYVSTAEDVAATAAGLDMFGWISYDTPYALKQHEDLEYHHADGKSAKYLENPVSEGAVAAIEALAAALRAAL